MFFPRNNLDEMSVHIWTVFFDRLSSDLPEYMQCLSLEEEERSARFHFEEDRMSYRISHGALRAILGSYLGIEPHTVRFITGETGKPELLIASTGGQSITFNMSHSGNMMILGVTRNRRIGVDVEMMNHNVDIFQIAECFFTAKEYENICEASAEKQLEQFFWYWTAKEAYLKAVGCGLAREVLGYVPPELCVPLLSDSFCMRIKDQWTLFSPRMPDGYIAAVLVEGERLSFFQGEVGKECNNLALVEMAGNCFY